MTAFLLCLSLIMTGAVGNSVQNGPPVDQGSVPESCLIFLQPERFEDKKVTVEAVLNENGDELRAPTECHLRAAQNLGFTYVLAISKTAPGRDFLKFVKEQYPNTGVHCSPCPRYTLTNLVARGKLKRRNEVKSSPTVVITDLRLPNYFLEIQEVLLAKARENPPPLKGSEPHLRLRPVPIPPL